MSTPEVSVIIPVFNRVELTRQCLEAVYRTVPPGLCEIVVVDNGSTDGTSDFLAGEAAAGRINFVRSERNLGFARACNLGAARSQGRYLLFLNNDTIPTPGWVEALLRAAALPGAGIVGAKLVYPDDTIQHAGIIFRQGRPDHVHRFAPGTSTALALRDFDMVTGACLLIPRDLFFAVGGFDETFVNSYEDVDLCLKVRALGRRVVYAPEAVVYHLEGQSEGRFKRDRENLGEFLARWRACFGRGGRFVPESVPPENLVSKRSLLFNPEFQKVEGALRVVWQAPLFDLSGYTDEARQFVLGLHEAGIPVKAVPLSWSRNRVKLPPDEALTLAQLATRTDPAGDGPAVGVFHAIPDAYQPMPGIGPGIARMMFETDRIPSHWVEILSRFDRVWVPSRFNLETFAESGVDPEKIAVIPSPIDARLLAGEAGPVEPLDIPGRRGFNFLSVLDFQLRKGWDVLVRAFTKAFGPDDDVVLIMKIFSYRGLSQARIRDEICRLLGRELPPNVILYFKELAVDEMPRLYAAADAFVLPSRGEGFCRPAAEAMASGLPVIITGWGGQRDFATPETAYLIDYELGPVPEAGWREVPYYRGHYWAEPSVEHLIALMREVASKPGMAKAKAQSGRSKVLGELDRRVVVGKVIDELKKLSPSRRTRRARFLTTSRGREGDCVPRLVWEGDFSSAHSFARVNRELCQALERASVPVVRIDASDTAAMGGSATPSPAPGAQPTLLVRHRWPPDFDPPRVGAFSALAVIQPWEYGAVPRPWVEGINRAGAELWVPSRFVRNCFVEGGVPAERVFVVPNGVDPERFHPGAEPLSLNELKGLDPAGAGVLAAGRLRFLFVGGTLWRKGIDVLLRAYTKAFGPKDDVVLIIKDVGTASFYRGQNFRAEIRRLELEAVVGKMPPIVYLDRELPDEALPGLYTACHCLVHPFRGEGFALPVAEAMACGLPVITTGAGPVLEFVDNSSAYLIPARPTFLKNTGAVLDGLELVGQPWVFEPDEDALIEVFRQVYQHYAGARKKGEIAACRIRQTLTWDHSARAVIGRLKATIGSPDDRPNHSTPGSSTAASTVGAVKAAAMEATPLISLCMIARDGARDLPRCLESVRGVVDEIIVVDTGSTDGTPEVARSFGAKVIPFTWTGSFADARNESLRHARGRWILVLDADEALGRGREKLREIVSDAEKGGGRGPAADGFFLPQVTYLGPEPGSADAVVVPALRLFKNLPGLKFGRRLHEQILDSLREVKPTARLRALDIEIEHYGYLSSTGKAAEKQRRNIELARKELAERPTDAFSWFNLGQEYYAAGHFEAALFCFRRAIRYLPGDYRMWLPRAIELAALSALKLGRPRGALELLKEAVQGLGEHPNLRLLEGQAWLALGEVAAARRAFAAALKAAHDNSMVLEIRNEGAASYAAWYWLGRCAELGGKPQEALGAFVESIRVSLAVGRCYRPAVEALVRLILPTVRSGQEFLGILKSLLPEISTHAALRAAVARAIFAEPPVPSAGLEGAAMLNGESREIQGFLSLFKSNYAEAAAAFRAAGADLLYGIAAALSASTAPSAPTLEAVVPRDPGFLSWLLGVLLQLREFEQFERLMPVVESLWPSPEATDRAVILGRLYSRFGFWDLVIETLAPLALAGHLDGDALSLLASALEKAGNLEAAEEVWLEVIRKDPRPFAAARAYAALAALRLTQGRNADAAQLLELATQLAGR